MKTTLQNFNGLFHVDSHKPSTRFLWILSVLLFLSVIIFGIWGIVVDFFDLHQNLEPQFAEIALVIFFTLVLPALGFIVGLVKIQQKLGIYLRGIRVTNKDLEIGTLTLDLDSAGTGTIWERFKSDNIVVGNWKQQKSINNEALDIEIVLRTAPDATNLFFFERFVFLSRKEILYQLIGKNSNEILWNDLVALSNGSVQLLEDTNGIASNSLFHFLEQLADIISICRPSHPPSCTLKIVTSPTSLGNVLATGMLGGAIISERKNYFSDKNTLENIFDKTFARSLRKFLKERDWKYSTEDVNIS
jgi:hypothetical protein